MAIENVHDVSDPRLAHYARLTDMQLRMVAEPREGIFIGEGEKVIRRALSAGMHMISVLMEPKWLPALTDVLPPDAKVYLAPPDLVRGITGYRVHRGALAAFQRPSPLDPAALMRTATTALLLEDLVDHANVGAIFRSAAALGVDAVMVTRRCADPWYRRSVKTSMGAVFAVPWATVPDAVTGVRIARDAGTTTIALDPAAPRSLRDWQPTGPTLLLLGSEGPGLSNQALAGVDLTLAIPMHNGVDSLNVAGAATLACYVLASP